MSKWRKLAVAICLLVAGGAALLWWDLNRSINSGDGWEVVSSVVERGNGRGDLRAKNTAAGVQFSMVVATGDGNLGTCRDPILKRADRADGQLRFGFQWPRRGCAHRGGLVVTVLAMDVPREGITVIFNNSPEACSNYVVFPDGTFANVEDAHCPSW